MARRPRAQPRQDETAYQRRIRLYKERHPGATTQEARGKPKAEHVARKQREIETFGFTTRQRKAINEFADEQTRRRDGKAAVPSEAVREKFQRQTREKGYAAFVTFRNSIHRKHRQKRDRSNRNLRRRAGGAAAGGGGFGGAVFDLDRAREQRDANLADMYELADEFFDDPDDWDLAFYH